MMLDVIIATARGAIKTAVKLFISKTIKTFNVEITPCYILFTPCVPRSEIYDRENASRTLVNHSISN